MLNDLKARGLAAILIAVVDGLKGFPDALLTAFPETTAQTYLVPLIRYSLACSTTNECKPLAAALKLIYQSANVAQAARLDEFERSELGQRYPDVVRTWRSRWEAVIPFLAFSPSIRRAIYTTKAIESLNARGRRAVPVRGHFTSAGAAKKLLYLAFRETSSQWAAPMPAWSSFKREFAIHFEGRFNPSKSGYKGVLK